MPNPHATRVLDTTKGKARMVFALDDVTFSVYGLGQINATNSKGLDEWFHVLSYSDSGISDSQIVKAAQAYLYNPSFRASLVRHA
jgi:hypothetical protein